MSITLTMDESKRMEADDFGIILISLFRDGKPAASPRPTTVVEHEFKENVRPTEILLNRSHIHTPAIK
ncbi:hypothetical protein VTN49DRAFT_1918 [Thermomyces lanuginosus]|uniref:uncharacterized protein n=1 Tax=Thermomyces lanuginosus TaxID=5541 RepID=UPI0037424197